MKYAFFSKDAQHFSEDSDHFITSATAGQYLAERFEAGETAAVLAERFRLQSKTIARDVLGLERVDCVAFGLGLEFNRIGQWLNGQQLQWVAVEYNWDIEEWEVTK